MGKKFIFIAISFICLSSCMKELRYDPPFEGEKLVLNGFISGSEVRIVLTHSVNPVRDFLPEEDLSVSDASVILSENDIPVTQLEYYEDGIYLLPEASSFRPEPGNFYSIQAVSPVFGEAKSDNIIFPVKLDVTVSSFESAGIENNLQSGLLSLYIYDFSGDNICFYISASSLANDNLSVVKYPFTDVNLYFQNCEAGIGFVNLYDNSCGFSNTTQQFSVSLQQYMGGTVFNPVLIRAGAVSRELFDYARSYNELSGIEYGFSEPPILKSNINGGYGLFYALNTTDHIITAENPVKSR